MKAATRARGFTLLELLVVMSLLSLVMLGMGSALRSTAQVEQRVDARYDAAAGAGTPFFALDGFGVKDWRATAIGSGVAMSRITGARPGEGAPSIDDGKIHHWAGAIFVPGVTIDRVMKRLSELAGQEQRHYEDVLAARVRGIVERRVWGRRYQTINRFEEQLVTGGTRVVKCFLHISAEEQRARLLARLDDPTKLWKYNPGDLEDRALWADYMVA